MGYIEEMARLYDLDCYHEGILPVRVLGLHSGEIYCAYRMYYRGSGQQAIRDMMANLQESLDAMIEAGIE